MDMLERLTGWVARRWHGRFYLYVAALFTLGVLVDAGVSHYSAQMRLGAYDRLVKHRIHVPKPDPDIVIVDIDEASLAAMGAEYGRWPWPRQVLGEFLEKLETQRPKAVLFDILFSDADLYNRDSDAYFDAAVAGTDNSYFPFLRLAEVHDRLSAVKPGRIPGVLPLQGEAQGEQGLAVVLPHFEAALASGRLGFHNIYPDPDGIVREYVVRRKEQGWEVPSLPLRLARDLQWPVPAQDRVLLNWRGPPFSYRYVSFKDVFDDFLNKDKRRPQYEFAGKLVLIGSTAPGLFDFKPTPVALAHPGVEILATALDNLKHDDFLRSPRGDLLYPLLTLLILWATAWVFYRDVGRDRIDGLFGASQFILIGVSFASLNFATTYINLTGPVTVGIAYFTVARIFAAASDRSLQRDAVRWSSEQGGGHVAALLLVHATGADERTLRRLKRCLDRAGVETKGVERLQSREDGIRGLLNASFAVSWVLPTEGGALRIAQDAQRVTGALETTFGQSQGARIQWQFQSGEMPGGDRAPEAWRALLARTMAGTLNRVADAEAGSAST